MPSPRPFRFSSPAKWVVDPTELRDRARLLEDLGYSTMTMSDHFDPQLGPISALQAAADVTTTLHVAALVLCNDYRHPAVLAKEAASLDLFTDGRFELGLGAGWMDADYEQAGMTKDPAGVRIDRLTESLDVLAGLWSDEPFSYSGRHYTITELDGTPKPRTAGGPPIIIGGGGRRVLQLAARRADIVGLNPNMGAGVIDTKAGPSATVDSTDEKLAWIRAAAGDRFDDLELHMRMEICAVTHDRVPFAELLAGVFGLTLDQALVTPHALVGPVELMIEQLLERRERWGISYIGVPVDAVKDFAPVVAELAGK
jgi:probable F420-dependent oxidoreductase